MIIAWMGWAALFTACAALAAAGAERLLAIWGLPRRAAWIGAMAAALIVPAVLAARQAPARPTDARASQDVVFTFGGVRASEVTSPPIITPRPATSISLTRVALVIWASTSVALLALIGASFATIRRVARRWPKMEVDGLRVRIAPDAGPAVIGVVRPIIVLPAWATELAPGERALMLRHESEHVHAGDPRWLLAAACVTALMPWNAALWLIAQRLRLAIEIDCDARVLRRSGDARDYGLLLLTVGARRGAPLPLAASLVERRPLIERRIVAMTSRRPSRPVLASLPVIALLGLTALAVAQAPQPTPLRASPVVPAAPVKATAPTAPAAPAPTPSAAAVPAPARPAPRATPAPKPASADTELATVLDTRPVARPREEITNEMIRHWIETLQPRLLQGDTSNAVLFVLNANGDVVQSDLGYDSGLAERMKRTEEVRNRVVSALRGDTLVTMRGRIGGGGGGVMVPSTTGGASGTPTMMPGRISGPGDGVMRSSNDPTGFFYGPRKLFSAEIASDRIEHLEVRNNNGGILDRPLAVVIVWLKP